MKTYIALFRGINVGGVNRLPMQDLRSILEAAGCRNVRTYLQSGNAVFQHEYADVASFSAQISSSIEAHNGFRPHVIIMGPDDLAAAIKGNPFPEAEAEPASLHVFFLDSVPQTPDTGTLDRLKKDSERYCLQGNLFYLHAPDGIGRSPLAARVEKALGVPATARNWRSVCEILELAKG